MDFFLFFKNLFLYSIKGKFISIFRGFKMLS